MGSEYLRLIYYSDAPQISEDDLRSILAASDRNNPGMEITGLLLYGADNFVQILEGPDQNLRELMKIIELDDRHDAVEIIMEEPMNERLFSEWNMSYMTVTDENAQALGGSFNTVSAEDLMNVLKTPDGYVGGFIFNTFKSMLGNAVARAASRNL